MAKRRKGGRPRKSGPRYPSGDLIQKKERAQPNRQVIVLLASFTAFQKPLDYGDIKDTIGKAYVAGLLNGRAADPQQMLIAGRFFAAQYRQEFIALDYRVANWDRTGKTQPRVEPTSAELRYCRMKVEIDRLSFEAQRAFLDLVLSRGDIFDAPRWIERLITERRAWKRLPVTGELPRRGDHEKLERALDCLEVLVADPMRKAS